jgi:hypothetical protein
VALFYFPRLFPEAVSLFPEARIAKSSGEEVLGRRSPREKKSSGDTRARGSGHTPLVLGGACALRDEREP